MSLKPQQGNLLIELSITISIITLIFVTLSNSSTGQWFKNAQEAQVVQNLYNLLLFARTQAIARNTMIAVDLEDNQIIIATKDQILLTRNIMQPTDTLQAHFFGTKNLQFLPNGTTNSTNGTFVYNHKYYVIINKQGRIKMQQQKELVNAQNNSKMLNYHT
jgi:Tfp pilus assembly protein FimT